MNANSIKMSANIMEMLRRSMISAFHTARCVQIDGEQNERWKQIISVYTCYTECIRDCTLGSIIILSMVLQNLQFDNILQKNTFLCVLCIARHSVQCN